MDLNSVYVIQLLVRSILFHCHMYQWTIQGLGMLRMYLSKDVRLHIWHSSAVVEGVSDMHTHPWDFESQVVVGRITDFLYQPALEWRGDSYHKQSILCGEGGGLMGDPEAVNLCQARQSIFNPGMSYWRVNDQIHRTEFINGTVTLVKRTFHEDVDHAFVYWPVGKKWVDAEPRIATGDEVAEITASALLNLPKLD